MGREVRMVPADWQHPTEFNSYRQKLEPVPLHDSRGRSYATEAAEWDLEWAKWQEGMCRSYGGEQEWGPIPEEHRHMRYTGYAGPRPSPDDYMPDWPEEQRTHLMMYEDTSEGTPISPAFETPEELARWLADNGASSFGSSTATYEQWLSMCRRGWAPSMIMQGDVLQGGVEALADNAA